MEPLSLVGPLAGRREFGGDGEGRERLRQARPAEGAASAQGRVPGFLQLLIPAVWSSELWASAHRKAGVEGGAVGYRRGEGTAGQVGELWVVSPSVIVGLCPEGLLLWVCL